MARSFEYFAGYFDGEGCVWAGYGSGEKVNCLQMKIRICSCDLKILEEFQKEFGGALKKVKTPKGKSHWKQAWNWYVCGKDAEAFASAIVQYSISKRKQLEAFLLLRKLSGHQGRRFSASELRKREKLVREIKELKFV